MSYENSQSVNRIFVSAIKGIIKETFKLCFIALAWCLRLSGLVLTKTGEAIEKIVVKKA